MNTSAAPVIWDSGVSYSASVLRDISVEMSIGLHPWEKHPERKQRVLVSVAMYAKRDKFTGSNIADCIDYDPVREVVRSWRDRPHTELLEPLVEELLEICFSDERVDACWLSIRKPDIFADAAEAGIEVYRLRSDFERHVLE